MEYTEEDWKKLIDMCQREGSTVTESSLFSNSCTSFIKFNLNNMLTDWDPKNGPISKGLHERLTAMNLLLFEKTIKDMPLFINNETPVIRAIAMWRLTIGK